MSFWGIQVRPGFAKSSALPEDTGIMLSNVALISGKRATFSVQIDEQEKFVVATLIEGVVPQHSVQLMVPPGAKVNFTNVGDGEVAVTGQLVVEEEEEEEEYPSDLEDEDEDEEGDEEEAEEEGADEEEKKPEQPKKKAAAAAAPAPAAEKRKEPEGGKKEKAEPAAKKEKKEGAFKCGKCDRSFGNEQALTAHTAAKHK